MTHSERIERIAREMEAEFAAYTADHPVSKHLPELSWVFSIMAISNVRRTLESLREPSEAMCDACAAADAETGYRARPVPLWRAMIDAAIKEAE